MQEKKQSQIPFEITLNAERDVKPNNGNHGAQGRDQNI